MLEGEKIWNASSKEKTKSPPLDGIGLKVSARQIWTLIET